MSPLIAILLLALGIGIAIWLLHRWRARSPGSSLGSVIGLLLLFLLMAAALAVVMTGLWWMLQALP